MYLESEWRVSCGDGGVEFTGGGAAPFILARRSGNRSGCLILSSTERFSPLSSLEDMLMDDGRYWRVS